MPRNKGADSWIATQLLQWANAVVADKTPAPEGISMNASPTAMVRVLGTQSRLNDLLTNSEVLSCLAYPEKKLLSSMPKGDALERFKWFFAETSWITVPATKSNLYQDRSILKDDLESLVRNGSTIIRKMQALREIIGKADSVPYLLRRLETGNSPGFIRNRKGFVSNTGNPALSALLSCFVEDIREELDLLDISIKRNRKPGGKRTELRWLEDMIVVTSINTLGRSFPSLITSVVAVLSGTPHDTSTIGKRTRAIKSKA